MNTDMNPVLNIQVCGNCCKKMTAYQMKALLCWTSSLAICAYRSHCLLLASERSEQDTIWCVQFRADAVRIYMYGGTCAIIVAHATCM